MILLGGGAEVRSYSAAGQALLLMVFVPFYSWFASRVDRAQAAGRHHAVLRVNIELFALAVAARVPLVGVAFFIWVGIFNISLIAQFWSYANDIYTKEAGDRLFPIITIGMTAGRPARLADRRPAVRAADVAPQVILQISAVLLLVQPRALPGGQRARDARAPQAPDQAPLAAGGGFALVFESRYLRLIALLIVLLNVVNTTGEYLIARLVERQAAAAAARDRGFNQQAYIGAFYGELSVLGQRRGAAAAGLRHVAAGQVPRAARRAAGAAADRARRLLRSSRPARLRTGALGQDGRERHRLLDHEHRARSSCGCPPRARRSTRPSRRSTRSSCAPATWCRPGSCTPARMARAEVAGFALVNVLLTLVWLGVALLILREHRKLAPADAA